MMMNDIAIKMLYNNPHELICTPDFQASILKIVRSFKKSGGFTRDAEADIVQEITTKILEKKITYLQKNYNPTFGKFKQYFERTVYNLATELVKASNIRNNYNYDLDQVNPQALSSSLSQNDNLVLDELEKIQFFLVKSPQHKHKLTLLLKLHSRTIITAQDILNYKPTATPEETAGLLEVFGNNYAAYDDVFLYKKINTFINQVEGKSNSPGAIRKWLNRYLSDLGDWMNRQSTFKYDKEALRDMMQLFFMNQKKILSFS